MATEVLLMTDVDGLGSEGDVVHVADGYARNYLFPKKIGAPVTDATRRRLARIRREREAAREAKSDAARETAAKLAGASCTIAVKTGEDEKMFGSVTAADIVGALQGQGVEIDRRCLLLEQPIRELGLFEIRVKLDSEVEATVKVWVVEE